MIQETERLPNIKSEEKSFGRYSWQTKNTLKLGVLGVDSETNEYKQPCKDGSIQMAEN